MVVWRIDPSTAHLHPTYSHVSPAFPTWHPDDGCGLLPHIVWTFRRFVSLQSAGGRFRFLVPSSGTTCHSTSHLCRHLRFSDNDSRPFCFPVPTKTLSYDSCVTITVHQYCLDTCGPCNNYHYLGRIITGHLYWTWRYEIIGVSISLAFWYGFTDLLTPKGWKARVGLVGCNIVDSLSSFSTIGRVQSRESLPAKDQHSITTEPLCRHSNPWITEVETIKWQTRLRMAVRLQAEVRGRGLGLRSKLYAGSVCDDSSTEVAYAAVLALYKWSLFLTYYLTVVWWIMR